MKPALTKMQAFTLLELLVSLVLASLLTLILFKLLMNSQQQLRYQQAYLQVNQSLALAQFYLSHDIQQAGMTSCTHLARLNVHDDSRSFNHFQAVQGYQEPFFPAELRNDVQPHTDVIRLQFTNPHSYFLTHDMSNAATPLELTQPLKLSSAQFLLISDCHQADLFKVEALNSQSLLHPEFSTAYTVQASVNQFIQHTYFIKMTDRKDDHQKFISSLYQQDSNGIVHEIVAGIDNLTLSYQQGQTYQSASSLTDWSSVKNIKVVISASSIAYFHQKPLHLQQTFYLQVRNSHA